MGAITTSIVVQITSPDGAADGTARCEVEVDSREDGLNSGKNQFYPGDSVYLLLYKDPNVTINSVTATSGTCVPDGGTGTLSLKELLTFANSDSSSTGKPAKTINSSSVIAGSATVLSSTNGVVKLAAPSVAIVRVDYTAEYTVYKLSGFPASLDGETNYPIVVYFQGTST